MSGAVKRFRVMALIAGVMDDWKAKVAWIPFVHGWVYAVYLLTAIQFSVKARWELRRVIWLALAGTLPIASFIAERKIVKTYS